MNRVVFIFASLFLCSRLTAVESSPSAVIFSDELILSPSFLRLKPKTIYQLAVDLGGENFDPHIWLEPPQKSATRDSVEHTFYFERRVTWSHFFTSILSQFRRSISQLAVAQPARSWINHTGDHGTTPLSSLGSVPVVLSFGLKMDNAFQLISSAANRGLYTSTLSTSVLGMSNFEICRSNQEGVFEERDYFQKLYSSLIRHVGLLVENGVKSHSIIWIRPYPVHQILASPQLLSLKILGPNQDGVSSVEHKNLFLWTLKQGENTSPSQGFLDRTPAFLYMMMNCPTLLALSEEALAAKAEEAANAQRNMADISLLALQQVTENFQKEISIKVSVVDPLAGRLLSPEDVDEFGFFPSQAYHGKVAAGVAQALTLSQ